jgi:putative hydrolase of the HAD superfamily
VAIRAVLFDIGGVLEITPPTGVPERWEARLGLRPGELDERTHDLFESGAVGAVSLEEVHRRLGEVLRQDQAVVRALMDDLWAEYLGTLNVELTDYVRGLRPRYRTGIISNSFVGAREKERERYQLDELTDLLVYSHEVGISKPDPRIYELACERLGVAAEEAVFVDDTEAMVDGARAVGMQALLFEYNEQVIADIEALLHEPSMS